MAQKLSFAVSDIKLEEDIDTSQFSLLSVDAFATGRSAHDTFTTEENLKRMANTIIQKPFVFVVDKRFNDAGGHDPQEVAAGFVPHNSRLEFKTLPDERVMLNCQVLVWKRYSGQLLDFFKRDGGKKGVSVEIEVFDAKKDYKSGLLELIEYSFNAITCLGDLIRPAIPNAEAVLQFSEEFKQAVEEYEFSSKYDSLDLSIPPKIKKNAEKALLSYKEKGSGATSVSLAMARFLVRNEKINPEKIRQIKKYFDRKNLNPDDISFGLFGGKDGAKWSRDLCESLDEIDNQRVSYFNVDKENLSSLSNEDDLEKKEEKLKMAKKKDESEAEEKTEMSAESEKEEETKKEEMASPDEKKEENQEEEKKEEMSAEEPKKEDEFSFGFDASVAMAMMPDEDEFCKMAKEEFAKGKDADFSVIAKGMYAAMCRQAEMCNKMSAEKETYMGRMSELETFKADSEKEQQKLTVDLTIKELSEKFVMSDDDISSMREDGYKVEFSNLENWKTSVRAKAVVDFAVVSKKENDGITRISLTYPFNVNKSKDGDLWIGGKS